MGSYCSSLHHSIDVICAAGVSVHGIQWSVLLVHLSCYIFDVVFLLLCFDYSIYTWHMYIFVKKKQGFMNCLLLAPCVFLYRPSDFKIFLSLSLKHSIHSLTTKKHVPTHMHAHTHTNTNVNTHRHIHTQTHTHIHTHTHTHTPV